MSPARAADDGASSPLHHRPRDFRNITWFLSFCQDDFRQSFPNLAANIKPCNFGKLFQSQHSILPLQSSQASLKLGRGQTIFAIQYQEANRLKCNA